MSLATAGALAGSLTQLCCAPLQAQERARVPLVRGLVMTSALRFPDGDRENVVRVTEASGESVKYEWKALQRRTGGGEEMLTFTRSVSGADLRGAPRLNTVYFSADSKETPGYTAFSLSSAIYDKVSSGVDAAFSNAVLDGPKGFGSLTILESIMTTRVLYRGTLSRLSTPIPFPLLVNGRRVNVPALPLRAHLAFAEKREVVDFWVQADRAHPLLLKIVTGDDVFQVVRVDVPGEPSDVARTLSEGCAVEIPGIHFAFNSAVIDPSSLPAIKAVAAALARYPAWTVVIEGHTDSVGSAQSNTTLSARRAAAVMAALVRDGVPVQRLSAAGRGATQPRETNTTLEGRARNRRVELVRACGNGLPSRPIFRR